MKQMILGLACLCVTMGPGGTYTVDVYGSPVRAGLFSDNLWDVVGQLPADSFNDQKPIPMEAE